MGQGYEIVDLRERPDLRERAAAWSHEKWGIPLGAYLESMAAMGAGPVPRWYAALGEDGEILGGVGAIENDFRDRPDLTPNVCALYVEEPFRRRGLAGALLERVCRDLRAAGVGDVYLLTDHTSFYERYGWEFLCMVQGDGDPAPSRMYVLRAERDPRPGRGDPPAR